MREQKKRTVGRRILIGVLAAAVGISTLGYTGYRERTGVYAAEVRIATVTATTLNVRTGAGTSYAKVISDGTAVYLKQGETAQILSEKDGWYQVSFSFQGKAVTGYISGDYVTISTKQEADEPSDSKTDKEDNTGSDSGTNETDKTDPDAQAGQTGETGYQPLKIPGRVTATSLRVRKGPGTSYSQLTVKKKNVSLAQKKMVYITGVEENNGERWYQISVTFDGKKVTGYVLSDYITLVVTAGERPNVKAVMNKKQYIGTTASSDKKKILTYKEKQVALKAGKDCTIIGEKTAGGEKWYQVKFLYGSKYLKGYVSARYVDFKRTEIVKEEPEEKPDDTGGENSGGTGGGSEPGTGTEDDTFQMQQGIVINGPVEVRVAAGYGSEAVKDAVTGLNHILASGQVITAYDKCEIDGDAWYLLTYEVDQTVYLGFAPASYIQLGGNAGDTSGSGAAGTILTDAEFEASMTEQGFPESYKPYLRSLHASHPYWVFEARQTGLDWNTVIANESKVGVNLITNSKNIAWKSMETGAYNWKNDKFVPYDGSTWVTASTEAVRYYMDPRNFLTESGIYQFELLSYQPAYQTENGVESILGGTPMRGASYSYVDDNGVQKTTTYAKTFMDAAVYSGVSPYHLASRSKQEIVTGSSSLSSSATGMVNGYEGLYNFYNIGATHSTVAGGAIINGLKYAQNGTPDKNYSSTMTFNDYIMIPWSSPYRSIVGGSAFIGYNYIQRGQNTVYLEKFNVTETSTYSHQYMANVEGAASESAKTAAAYSQMADTPVVFSIPVYLNMPETACTAPEDKLNPNNWLKSLAVDGYSLTPTFDPEVEQVYSLIVENSVTQVTISAQAASSKASVSGAGVMELVPGNNTAVIAVTAENGDPKIYILNIIRETE